MEKIYIDFKGAYDCQGSSIEITKGCEGERVYDGYINLTLKHLREGYGLSQQNLADVLGISKTEYWRMEQSQFLANPQRIIMLAYFYNVSLDYLYGLQTDHSSHKIQEDVIFVVNGYCLDDFTKKNFAKYNLTNSKSEKNDYKEWNDYVDKYKECVHIPDASFKEDYLMFLSDNSMEGPLKPNIPKNTNCFINRAAPTPNGCAVAALIEGRVYIRFYELNDTTRELILRPNNYNYDLMIFSWEELNKVKILGPVVRTTPRDK